MVITPMFNKRIVKLSDLASLDLTCDHGLIDDMLIVMWEF